MQRVFRLILFAIYIKYCECLPVYSTPVYLTPPLDLTDFNLTNSDINDFNLTNSDITDFNITTHLESEHVKRICKNKDALCKSNNTRICAVRKMNETFKFKDFENSCYLFLSNLCNYPENEFYIVEASSCNLELTRRHYEASGVGLETEAAAPENATWDGDTTKADFRAINISKYDVAMCPQRHPCAPVSCPNFYRPVCMNVNHRYSNNPKFYTFVNHCEMDRFFCKHYKEFEVVPHLKMPGISMSYIEWSLCSAQRYLKFLFTARAASSLGHYGWLDGDERYSKILEPWQRKPGYG